MPAMFRLKTIGFLGKTSLTAAENAALTYIGWCLARLGHKLAIVPAPGTATVLREAVESEGGETISLDKGVIESSDHTLIYPDRRLLYRLLTKYPDLHERDNVTVIRDEADLILWVPAIRQVLLEQGRQIPDHE